MHPAIWFVLILVLLLVVLPWALLSGWGDPPPMPDIHGHVEIRKLQSWADYFFHRSNSFGSLEIGSTSNGPAIYLRNRRAAGLFAREPKGEVIPTVYAYDPSTGNVGEAVGESSLSIEFAPCEWASDASAGSNHRGAAISVDGDTVLPLGDYVKQAYRLPGNRYLSIVSINGPTFGGWFGFSSGYRLGQSYHQVYDTERRRFVGQPIRLPFRWGGLNEDLEWAVSCASGDARFVIFYPYRYAAHVVFVPTGVSAVD